MEAGRTVETCRKCGASLPPDAPQGFCPACLLERAFVEKPVDPPQPPSDLTIEPTGAIIGRYKLLEQIGEGGFGVVYMAEQLEPVQRKVALKIIKAGMDTKEVIARFEAERQALALMDHPNIAKILDGGMTGGSANSELRTPNSELHLGRPYFVMELVRGIPITKFCDQRQLDTKARLELFMRVCKAVQHAHQKGIIHRDLKPSNILVTHHESEPMPKIIDFGVAKALGQKLTDKTLFTGFLRMVGTPAYMSPEQAEFTGMDVDTRSDVYSLGVLLYELLTGVTPFDPETLRNAALDEVRRMIRETDPPKPSTRLETLGERIDEIAHQRHTEATKLRHALQGDLDWIVMKCLEKDRRRRYETVNGLAVDVQRHLDNEPVVARPPSTGYRLQKLVQRNKLAFGAGTAVAATLVIGLTVSMISLFREKAARERAVTAEREQIALRQQADAEKQIARTEAARSAQVAQFMSDMLAGVGPGVARGRDTELLREILDQTAGRLSKDLADQPEVEAELRNTLGVVYRDLGEYWKAAAMHREALAINQALHESNHLAVAESLDLLGQVLHRQVEHAQAEDVYREALEIQQRLLGEENLTVAATLTHLGSLLRRVGNRAEAEPMLREALATRRRLLGNQHLDVAESLSNLALLLNSQKNYTEAETLYREALAIRRALQGEDHFLVADVLSGLSGSLVGLGRLAEAEAVRQEVVEMNKDLLGPIHPNTIEAMQLLEALIAQQGKNPEAEALRQERLAIQEKALTDELTTQRKQLGESDPTTIATLQKLANLVREKKKYPEAEQLFREALAILKNLHGGDSSEAASAMVSLAGQLEAQGKLTEAQTLLEEALAIHRTRLKAGHPETIRMLTGLVNVLARQGENEQITKLSQAEAERLVAEGEPSPEVAKSLDDLGHALWLNHQFSEAEKLHRSAVAEWKSVQPDGGRELAHVIHHLADALRDQGKLAEAETVFHEALAMQKKVLEENDGDVVETLECLGGVLQRLGRPKEAESVQREGLAIRHKRLGDEHPNVLKDLHNLAHTLMDQGKLAEAESLFNEALAKQRKVLGDEHEDVVGTRRCLCNLLHHVGRLAEAVSLLRESGERGNLQDLNGAAWLVATCVDPTVRDGETALAWAEQVVAATGRTNINYLETLAVARAELRQFSEAVKIQQEAIALVAEEEKSRNGALEGLVRLFKSNLPFRDYAFHANLCLEHGKLAEAEGLFRSELEMRRKMGDGDDPGFAGVLAQLTLTLLREKEYAAAEPCARECLAIRETQMPDHWLTFNARSLLGGGLLGQRQYAEAEPLLISGYEGMMARKDQIPPAGKTRPAEALERLLELYIEWDKPDQAAKWKQAKANAELPAAP